VPSMLVELVSVRRGEASRNGAPTMELEEQNNYAKMCDETLIHRKVLRLYQDYKVLAVGTLLESGITGHLPLFENV
jgi:hypothetical protein